MRKKMQIVVKLDPVRNPIASSLSQKRGRGQHADRKKAACKKICRQVPSEDEND